MAATASNSSQKNLPGSKRKSTHQIPLLSEDEISELAKKFAESIPEDEMSVSLPIILRVGDCAHVLVGRCATRVPIEEQDTTSRVCRRSRGMGHPGTRDAREAEEGESRGFFHFP